MGGATVFMRGIGVLPIWLASIAFHARGAEDALAVERALVQIHAQEAHVVGRGEYSAWPMP